MATLAAICSICLFSASLVASAASVEAQARKPQSRSDGTPTELPPERRAVPQQHLPRAPISRTPAAPVARQPVPIPAVPGGRAPEAGIARPTAPAPLTSCDASGCWNGGAERYQGGTGPTYLDRAGRLCQRQGTWMQCF